VIAQAPALAKRTCNAILFGTAKYGDDEKGLAMQLTMNTRNLANNIIAVDLNGRIVFGEESAFLRDAVRKLITQSNRVLLNLQNVSYIHSGGLGTLVSLYTTARNAGGAIKLSNLNARVDDLLQVTKLVTIFEVFGKEAEAVESFGEGAAA